jgi:hypothetical protein
MNRYLFPGLIGFHMGLIGLKPMKKGGGRREDNSFFLLKKPPEI